jgi:hypothetical protein
VDFLVVFLNGGGGGSCYNANYCSINSIDWTQGQGVLEPSVHLLYCCHQRQRDGIKEEGPRKGEEGR